MEQPLPAMTREEWMKIAYDPNPPDVPQDTRKLLETYSKIPSAEVLDHVVDIRNRGFKEYPYPCIGMALEMLDSSCHPRLSGTVEDYAGADHFSFQILSRMNTGEEKLLDLGCAFAQDIRRLVADGVDSSNCFGSDLRLQFLDLGHELFRDKESLKTRFIEADIFDEKSALNELNGKLDIINASSFFHLFAWEEQKQIARRCIRLMTGKQDNLVVGRQVGNEDAGETPTRTGQGTRYRHNIDSWRRMWSEIGEETGATLTVQAQFADIAGVMPGAGRYFGREEGTKMMVFSVRRVN